MIYGYARCSTDETKQNVDRQLRDLKNLGVERQNIFMEYESGSKINRVELNRLLDIVSEGDTVVATESSRLTRSMKQLIDIIDFCKEKKLKLVLGNFVMDCTGEIDPMTEGMLKMMGVFSEMERGITVQRVLSGVHHARSMGKVIGRPKLKASDIPEKVIKNYHLYESGEIGKSDYARLCCISRPTLDKYLRIMNEEL